MGKVQKVRDSKENEVQSLYHNPKDLFANDSRDMNACLDPVGSASMAHVAYFFFTYPFEASGQRRHK